VVVCGRARYPDIDKESITSSSQYPCHPSTHALAQRLSLLVPSVPPMPSPLVYLSCFVHVPTLSLSQVSHYRHPHYFAMFLLLLN